VSAISTTQTTFRRLAARRAVSTRLMIAALAAGLATSFAAAGLLQHFSYHSHGWDLGFFHQILWNTASGRPFEHSFREISYLGDHWQPVLLLLVPLVWLNLGPAPLLVVQGFALGAAAIPLFAASKRMAGATPAWLIVGAYAFGLAQARTATYDFHPECFVPILAFSCLWALVSKHHIFFIAAALGLLLLKEDAFLLTFALCWVAWFAFGLRREALVTATVAILYAGVVTMLLMPEYSGDGLNPLRERYGYLGDNLGEILLTAISRPDLLVEHLAQWSTLEGVALVLLGAALLPLLSPRLWLPLALLILIPALADHEPQRTLSLHYLMVPATFATVLAVISLRSPVLARLVSWLHGHVPLNRELHPAGAGAAAMFGIAIALYAALSPLPPSFSADPAQFRVDAHSRIAESFVDMIPDGIPVSAQATFVPHLSQRKDIYEFPRVVNAEWVLLDAERRIPLYDRPAFDDCAADLPALGFEVAREEDGISLWRKIMPATLSVESSHCS